VRLSEIRRFRAVLRRFERLTHHQLKNCCGGVTLAQCLVLLQIEGDGSPNMGRLASELRLDGSTLTRTVDGLVGRGLAARLPDDRDRRAVRIRLTPSGAAECRSIHEVNDGWCLRVFEKIPKADRAAVIGNFEILVQAFLESEGEAGDGACCDAPAARAKSGQVNLGGDRR